MATSENNTRVGFRKLSDFEIANALIPTMPKLRGARRVHEIIGDNLSPAIKPGDFLAVSTAFMWHGDGIYLIDDVAGIGVYRCQAAGHEIWLLSDNSIYETQRVSRDWFAQHVLAKAIGHMAIISH